MPAVFAVVERQSLPKKQMILLLLDALISLLIGTLPQHQLLATMKLTLLTALFLQKMTLTVKYMATTRTLMASQPTKLAVSVVEVWEKACHPIWFPPLLLRIPQPLDLLLTGRRHLHPVLIQQIARMMNNSSLRTRRRRHAKNGLRVLRKTRAHSPRTIRKSKSCAKRNGKENTYLNIVRKHVLKSVRVPVPRETDPYNQCHGLSVSAV
mmetsp:Transcript_10390/g.21861  ORF Transcript_10390/g.21861 Transcript_10390/m.21861 type:complete len:209 (-) Transcript_10390:1695-2321(-)